MSTKKERMQKFVRYYKGQTGKTEVEMHEVAEFAIKMGWTPPVPPKPVDLLARQFSDAEREEVRYDRKTGKPYRANHAYTEQRGNKQTTLWIDIDENPPRTKLVKSVINRREQVVGDLYHLMLDTEHWNNEHPNEEPIQLPLDFTDDVEWRKNGPEEQAI